MSSVGFRDQETEVGNSKIRGSTDLPDQLFNQNVAQCWRSNPNVSSRATIPPPAARTADGRAARNSTNTSRSRSPVISMRHRRQEENPLSRWRSSMRRHTPGGRLLQVCTLTQRRGTCGTGYGSLLRSMRAVRRTTDRAGILLELDFYIGIETGNVVPANQGTQPQQDECHGGQDPGFEHHGNSSLMIHE